ncbi:PREDICTED: tumor necrosis factor ligand superfamily member 10-like [Branchiostoma belcheri]|uniref:Tumor necrosis factor ligand superfamily member 10 n=1 Tax=Branchiostoma belcheri TaxID=7741 RepID=A0A6P5AAP8_BRABE|nr:PREDICTED: tumor necrosis factor ligand superfamily member 10-like [Branchiostoma belcheri]
MAARSTKRQDSECSTAPLAEEVYERKGSCASHCALVVLCSVLTVVCAGLCAGLAVMWVYLGQQLEDLRNAYEKLELTGLGGEQVNITAAVDEAVRLFLEDEQKADRTHVGPPLQTGWSSGSSKPMAHLTGNPRQNIKKHHGEVKLRSWESEQGLATLANGMKYRGGNIVIPADGLYYIYSQLSYRFLNENPFENPKEDANIFQLIHYTYKQSSYPEPQMIMKSSRSTCWSKRTEFGLYTSFQGGVFRLEKGDKVSVSVSNPQMICFEESSSFFGAFMI